MVNYWSTPTTKIPQNHSIHCGYSCFEVKDVSYRPPGTELNLLNKVTFSLPERSFGLIFGQSGSGKTTLLQLLSGISKPTSGSICVQRYGNDGIQTNCLNSYHLKKLVLSFNFPRECCSLQSRYFVADTIADEVTFGWPRRKSSLQLREHLVGLNGVSLDKDPHSLSGGYKRRLPWLFNCNECSRSNVQVEVPDLLILDEPLAGLDWKARADVVKLLKHLKKELTVLVVSHDLKELEALVDHSWRMEIGGFLREELLPVMCLAAKIQIRDSIFFPFYFL
ncbi:ABC transporter family member [Salix suchowensis]|nr:ABC transporter family member [Salix suchowensis]